MNPNVSAWITPAVIVVTFALMLLLESFRPLRRTVEPKLRRMARNLSTGGVSLAVVTLLQAPVLAPVSDWATRERFGINQWLSLESPWNVIVGIVLLDYTLWWWHRATHQIPFLWRFHLVHHIDLDLDTTTALRFHFGEMALSIFYRAIQIALLGIEPFTLWLWQTILFASILIHHSNWRLPDRIERILVRFIVTPRMHGIHHSNRKEETNSNWSSLSSLWDFLHGTIRLDVPSETITIGVPAYSNPQEVTFGKIQLLPFRHQREDWQSPPPADGRKPQ